MRSWLKSMILVALLAAAGLAAPGAVSATPVTAAAAPYCGIVWGSLPKVAGGLSTAPIVNVRAGQHPCFDRLVVDVAGGAIGYQVRYVPAVLTQGRGSVIPLRGGAFLEIVVLNPTYDINSGASTYNPINPAELVDVCGWQTFRQIASGGSYEGYTTIGLGVRARLPFEVFTLPGPGTKSRLVIDVAHHW